MRARLVGAVVVAALVVAGAAAPAGAVLGTPGKWYGVFTHYEDLTTHDWVAYTKPLAHGINVRFTVAPADPTDPSNTRIKIARLAIKPIMWKCAPRHTSIRFGAVMENIPVSADGLIPNRFSSRRILHPVLRPKVRLRGWRPRAIAAVSGRFSEEGFADGTMFLAVGGCGWFVNQVWIAIRPAPSEVGELTTPPPAEEIPSSPDQADTDGEDWIGCHLLWCTPYSLPPFSIPDLF